MAADGHDDVSKEQWEFSRRRFLRYAGGAAAAGSAYAGLAGLLGDGGRRTRPGWHAKTATPRSSRATRSTSS